MARYEIYVVTSQLSKTEPTEELEELKGKLCEKYGGLTVIPNCTGYWLNDNKILEYDNVEIWVIFTNSSVITAKEFIEYGEQLKQICNQKSQMITVNGNPYFV
jgi:hypothetical protein